MRDVAIVAVAAAEHIRHEPVRNEVEILMPVVHQVFDEAGITKEDIGFTCSGTSDFLAGQLLSRPLRPEELAVVKSSLEKFEQHYQSATDDAQKLISVGESKEGSKSPTPQLAAWTMVANQLMNLDEVLNK